MRGLRLFIPVALAALAAAAPLHGQAEGAISGVARQKESRAGLGGVQVLVDDRVGALSDTAGRYRVRAVRTGWHRVAARLIGYRGVVLDSVFVPAGATVTVDFELEANPQELEPLVVTAPYDAVLDPLATSTEQKITAADLRDLPISSLEEALELSAGSVGTSYRGGRLGQESFILDGLGREESARRLERRSRTPDPARPPQRGVAGHQRLLGTIWPGALRPGERGDARSRREMGGTRRV